VLVVDPGASDLLFVEAISHGTRPCRGQCGKRNLALRLASQTSFDAVVCDARLLGRDGTPVAAALRETNGCACARFVLSVPTGFDAQAPASDDRRCTLVTRPYDVEELRRLIEGD